jgi:ABC-type antimicrobial peptide transport system permease subunit
MCRFELGTRMAIGAKRKDSVGLIVKDNVWVIVIGMLTSVLVMLGLHIWFAESLENHLNTGLISMLALTILSIAALSLFACYWPLRRYINQPVVHSLRGSD